MRTLVFPLIATAAAPPISRGAEPKPPAPGPGKTASVPQPRMNHAASRKIEYVCSSPSCPPLRTPRSCRPIAKRWPRQNHPFVWRFLRPGRQAPGISVREGRLDRGRRRALRKGCGLGRAPRPRIRISPLCAAKREFCSRDRKISGCPSDSWLLTPDFHPHRIKAKPCLGRG